MDLIWIVSMIAIVLIVVVAAVAVRRRRTDIDLGVPAAPPREEPTAAPERVAPAPSGLRARLGKTRQAMGERLSTLLRRSALDDQFWSELEDTLVAADLGVATATELVERVRAHHPSDPGEVRALLVDELTAMLSDADRSLHLAHKPAVVLVVGVNGTGKTTSIAKLAAQLQREGKSVLLGAADTFRAAADEQLRRWAERVGVEVVGGQPGADPASVAFDAYQAAKARGIDVLLVDTAGRLQSKANLMDELAKVARVLRREAGDLDEVLLVLDGTTGQNGIAQAKSFTDAVGVTGIVLTKLDGTARGGVVVAVERELGIPVKFIGVGEGIDDLIPFDPKTFADAVLGN